METPNIAQHLGYDEVPIAQLAQPQITAILANDIAAFTTAYQQNHQADVFDYTLDRVPDKISVAMALAIRRLLPADQANDTLISSALVNGRVDILDALIADGWQPDEEFIGAHIIMLNDAAGEKSLDRKIVDSAYWMVEKGFVRAEELSERFGLGEVRN